MRRIYKYPLENVDTQRIDVPYLTESKGFKNQLLHVDVQDNVACLWCMVDDDQLTREVFIRVVGTGHIVPAELTRDDYLGSYMLFNGSFVGHVFAA